MIIAVAVEWNWLPWYWRGPPWRGETKSEFCVAELVGLAESWVEIAEAAGKNEEDDFAEEDDLVGWKSSRPLTTTSGLIGLLKLLTHISIFWLMILCIYVCNVCRYRMFIKSCVFFVNFKIYSRFSVGVYIGLYAKWQVEDQRCSRTGRVGKNHNILRKKHNI